MCKVLEKRTLKWKKYLISRFFETFIPRWTCFGNIIRKLKKSDFPWLHSWTCFWCHCGILKISMFCRIAKPFCAQSVKFTRHGFSLFSCWINIGYNSSQLIHKHIAITHDVFAVFNDGKELFLMDNHLTRKMLLYHKDRF